VWLSLEAKRTWRRLLPELKQMHVLTYVDGDALAAYCQTYGRWRAAEEFLQKHGEVYPIRDEQGRVKCMQQFPQVAIARNLILVLRAYQQEFGLTPAARSRVGTVDSGAHRAVALNRRGEPI
jgi:P27 family predicted phage terminase small subunit